MGAWVVYMLQASSIAHSTRSCRPHCPWCLFEFKRGIADYHADTSIIFRLPARYMSEIVRTVSAPFIQEAR